MENVLSKVRKLLALADKSKNNTREAELALLKAHELMAKHGITSVESETDKINHLALHAEHKWDMGYRVPLAQVIAENFRCKIFSRGTRIHFFGREDDVLIAIEAFEFAYKTIYTNGNREYNTAKNEGRRTKGVFNSYAQGFIVGIKEKLGEQSVALMVITPQDVKDKFEEMTQDWNTKASKMQHGNDMNAFFNGKRDGKEAFGTKKLR